MTKPMPDRLETIEVPPPNGRKAPERRTGGAMVYNPTLIAVGRVVDILDDPGDGVDPATVWRLAGEVKAIAAARDVPARERLPEQDPFQ